MPIQSQSYGMDSDITSDESCDSDQIDSDIEAELYSTIHHEKVSTEPEENSDLNQNSSINIISKEGSIVEEMESHACNKFNMNFGFNSILNRDRGNIENESMSLKRKSSFVAEVLDNIQVQSSSKKRKTSKRARHFTNSNLNNTIVISDSDSDSVIFSEPDEVNIQTNIETFVVSSDSDSSFTFLNESRLNFNQSRSNLNGNYKDAWKINDTDLYRNNRRSTGRYHEDALVNCSNCNKKGHTAKNCSERKVIKCIICGGMHTHSVCNLKVCTKCLRFGHDSRNCFFPIHYMCCRICNTRGHNSKCCPDLWRRYHLTTSGDHIVKGNLQRQTSPLYCYNCGLQGHHGFDCNKCRMDRGSFPFRSSVVSYEKPGSFFGNQQRDTFNGRNISAVNCYDQLPIPARIVKDSKIEERRLTRRREKKRRRQLRKKQREAQNNIAPNQCIQQQFKVDSTSNNDCKIVHVKEKGNFRTPNVNQSQLVSIPKQMKTSKRAKMLKNLKRKELRRRKQLLDMKKHIAN